MSWVPQWNKQTIFEDVSNKYLHIYENMGATVEQDDLMACFIVTNMIFKLIARCHSGIGKKESVFVLGVTVEQANNH